MPDTPDATLEAPVATPAAAPAAAPVADAAANPNPDTSGAPATSAADATPADQSQRNEPPKWAVDRISELVAKRKAAEDRAEAARLENETLQRELQRLRTPAAPDGTPAASGAPAGTPGAAAATPGADVPLHPNLQELAETMADNIARQRLAEQSLADRTNAVEEAGKKEFGEDFDRSVRNLAMAGVGSPAFLEAVTAIPQAEKLLRYLGSGEHIDEATRIARLPPVQMGIELMRISGDAIKTYTKQVSAAPAPIAPLEGSGSSNDAEPDPTDTKAWVAWRNKTARRHYR